MPDIRQVLPRVLGERGSLKTVCCLVAVEENEAGSDRREEYSSKGFLGYTKPKLKLKVYREEIGFIGGLKEEEIVANTLTSASY